MSLYISENRYKLCPNTGEPLGVFFLVEGVGRDRHANFEKPVVPETWDFDQIKTILRRRVELLKALPTSVTHINRNMQPHDLDVVPVAKCQTCLFFDAACCAIGHGIDWAGEGLELGVRATTDKCEDYRAPRKRAEN